MPPMWRLEHATRKDAWLRKDCSSHQEDIVRQGLQRHSAARRGMARKSALHVDPFKRIHECETTAHAKNGDKACCTIFTRHFPSSCKMAPEVFPARRVHHERAESVERSTKEKKSAATATQQRRRRRQQQHGSDSVGKASAQHETLRKTEDAKRA